MSREEIIASVADILEVEEKDLDASRALEEYESWDSVAVLSVVSLYTDISGKFIHASDVLKLRTVGELMEFLNA